MTTLCLRSVSLFAGVLVIESHKSLHHFVLNVFGHQAIVIYIYDIYILWRNQTSYTYITYMIIAQRLNQLKRRVQDGTTSGPAVPFTFVFNFDTWMLIHSVRHILMVYKCMMDACTHPLGQLYHLIMEHRCRRSPGNGVITAGGLETNL